MAPKTKQPITLSVVRRGKTFTYQLSDTHDWAVLFENAVLEVKTIDGKTHYWTLDSVTQWITQPCPQNGHA